VCVENKEQNSAGVTESGRARQKDLETSPSHPIPSSSPRLELDDPFGPLLVQDAVPALAAADDVARFQLVFVA